MTMSKSIWGELRSIKSQCKRTVRFLTARERLMLATTGALMAAVGYLTAMIPITLGKLIDAILHHRVVTITDGIPLLAWLASAYLAREALQVVRKIMVEGTATRITSRATAAAIATILRLDLSAFTGEQAGTLSGRLNRSVVGMVRLLKLSFLDFFPALFGACFALAVALEKNLIVGLVMALVVPIGLTIILFQLSSQRGIRLSLIEAHERMDGILVEQIGGIETVRAADAYQSEIGKVVAIAETLRACEFKHHIEMALFDAGKALVEGGFHIGVISVAIMLALAGEMSAGDILAISLLFAAVMTPLKEIHRIIDEAHESSLNAEKFFELLVRPIDVSFATACTDIDPAADPVIEVEDLRIGYASPDGSERVALNGVTLAVRRGEMIGLAGSSGSGKTTFVRSLLRLVHPRAGVIKVGGMRIEALSRANVKQMFGFVGQTPFLFSGTIAENIAFGTPGVALAQIKRAAQLARIDAEIETFPGGYGYGVGERGGNLSGGQRQRVALARVFLQNPPILILDEATAALDGQNERAVMEAIAQVLEGRTVVMIAHRQSSLKRADRIIVFRHGEIVEEGTFDGLLGDKASVFSQIVREDRAGAEVGLLEGTHPAGDALLV